MYKATKTRNMMKLFAMLLLALTMQSLSSAAEQQDVSFKFSDLDGKAHHSSDYRGQWVVVNFWATWCTPCIKEIPELKHFYDEYRQQSVVVLGVNYEELTMKQLEQAIEEFAITYPVLHLGPAPEMSEAMVLKGLPSTFLISPNGKLIKTWVGPVHKVDLVNVISPLLASNDGAQK